MALTSEKREALKLARALIVSRKSNFICFALLDVARDYPDIKSECHQIIDYIGESLGHSCSLGAWQDINGFGNKNPFELRLDRIAWIDWMLGD